jgi:SAM-dependent methyltransferase
VTDGWEESAVAWIAEMGDRGDFSREFVLDAPMLARATRRPYRAALDVGCGEGRFCRMLRANGIPTVGLDPTRELIARAAERDLVVSYLSLIDIPDLDAAIAEMVRVLAPGGTLLIANLNGFATAAVGGGWTRTPLGGRIFKIDHYLEERAEWAAWRGIRVQNRHRPLSRYLRALLERGLILRHFDEPAPSGGDAAKADRYRRVPLFLVMEWEKPR